MPSISPLTSYRDHLLDTELHVSFNLHGLVCIAEKYMTMLLQIYGQHYQVPHDVQAAQLAHEIVWQAQSGMGIHLPAELMRRLLNGELGAPMPDLLAAGGMLSSGSLAKEFKPDNYTHKTQTHQRSAKGMRMAVTGGNVELSCEDPDELARERRKEVLAKLRSVQAVDDVTHEVTMEEEQAHWRSYAIDSFFVYAKE